MAGMSVFVCLNLQAHGAQMVMEQAAADAAAALPCHEAMAGDQAMPQDNGCDNCEICHLASAGFMPSAPLGSGVLPVGSRFDVALIAAPPSFIAEPPQHPPRRAA